MMNSNNNKHNIDIETTGHVAQLEAANANLRADLSSKESYIAMLEERLLKMSIELASSRAAEDEQHLMYRRRHSSPSQPPPPPAAAKEFVPDPVVSIKPIRDKHKGSSHIQRRRSSDSGKEEDDAIDYSTGSAAAAPVDVGGDLFSRRNSCNSSSSSNNNNLDDSIMSFSERSSSFFSSLHLGWGAVASQSQDNKKLSVDFPESRRRSSESSGGGGGIRRLSIGTVFRKSDNTEATATTAEESGYDEVGMISSSLAGEGEGASTEQNVAPSDQGIAPSSRRRSSRRGKDPPQALTASSRSFLSCVVFPRDEEDVLLGCE